MTEKQNSVIREKLAVARNATANFFRTIFGLKSSPADDLEAQRLGNAEEQHQQLQKQPCADPSAPPSTMMQQPIWRTPVARSQPFVGFLFSQFWTGSPRVCLHSGRYHNDCMTSKHND